MARALEARFGVPSRRPSRDLVGSLVGTILSQNTADTNSSRAYAQLRERFPQWADVERADPRSIEAAIRSGGLARTKSRRIRQMLRDIRRTRGALHLGFLRRMDTDAVLEYLESIDGVGPKTAACVALFDLGREVMPVDTHIHRVIGRTGVLGKTVGREATFRALRQVVPEGKALSLHLNMIRLGRELCRPREPRCQECPILKECDYGLAQEDIGTSRAGSARTERA
jgi:endonuclease-3